MALLRVRAGLGVALCAGGCGFDSSGTGTGGAEIGDVTGADDAASATGASTDAGPGPGDVGDATMTGSGDASDSATTGTATAVSESTGPTDPSAGTTGGEEWGPFEGPWPIIVLNSGAEDDDPTLRGDLLEIVFASTRSTTSEDLMVAVRGATNEDFSPPQYMDSAINTADFAETTPEMTTNGLVLTFSSDRPGGSGGSDLYFTWRATLATPWAAPQRILELSTSSNEAAFVATDDALVGYFCRYTDGFEEQLMRTVRPSIDVQWGAAVELRIDTPVSDCSPWVAANGGELWFNSWREGGQGEADIWFSRINKAVGEPEVVEELNSPERDEDPWLSAAGDLIVFASDRAGPTDLYWAVRGPP